MNNDFIQALEMLEKDRGIEKSIIIETIEAALLSAYKKNYEGATSARVAVDTEDGHIDVFAEKTVVEEVNEENNEITLSDAKKLDPDAELGGIVEILVTPDSFGRIAAQTAKQVLIQRIREAERGNVFDEYTHRINEVVPAVVQRADKNCCYLELNKTDAIMPSSEYIYGEKLNNGDRVKVFIYDVKKTLKGPQVYVSRSHPGLIKRLFEMEIPEIAQGIVQIKGIAREAGMRSKIAVSTTDDNIDPVGSCVGQKGIRIEHIVSEICNEKIDIIPWSADPVEYITNALRPAKVTSVRVNIEDKTVQVVVPDNQLSLAIGREGQNARLAVKLTGYKIDIKSAKLLDDMFDRFAEISETLSNEEIDSEMYTEELDEIYGIHSEVTNTDETD